MANETAKTWLITGVSRGIGAEVAARALARGDRVAGTVRTPEQAAAFERMAPGRASALLADMTDGAAIVRAVGKAEDELGQIDVLVNNAGYGLVGALEEYSEGELRRQMEVNFFGAVATMRAALPGMRARGKGRIVNVSSIAGLAPYGGFSLYAASKYAVEGASLSLAQEVAPLGIRVTLVEPGAIRTDWAGASMVHAERVIEDYAHTTGEVRAFFEDYFGKQPGDPAKVAGAILAVADAGNPPRHLVLGSDAWARIHEEIEALRRDLEAWRETTLSTDIEALSAASTA
ncbi:oxidoreductase [uncultured Roseobacter sp.]|uniref:oxidoreductase n=1 Tax=uncultured Roseobacter sp. TaxID=114847 RepID=UPI0026188520|nr:oxidoreductase [uncultured Roseobacter sp.]